MKLYFLKRTEFSDRVVGKFRAAEVADEEAVKLLESGTAIKFGEKRAIPRLELIRDIDRPQRGKEINRQRKRDCRESIESELNQIVYDRFMEFYANTNPALNRATRVATATAVMREEAYPYLDSNCSAWKAWNNALMHIPPKMFPDAIPRVSIFDKKTHKKIGERYLW